MSELERLRNERDDLRVQVSLALGGQPGRRGELEDMMRTIAIMDCTIDKLVFDLAARTRADKRARHENHGKGV